MEASLCLKSCEDHSLLKSYDGGLLKTITGLDPKRKEFAPMGKQNSLQLVRKKIRKRRLFKKVQAFCEEKVVR